MSDPRFFAPAAAAPLAQILEWSGAAAPPGADLSRLFKDAGPLDQAGPDAVSFLDNAKYSPLLAASRAGAVFVAARLSGQVPASALALVAKDPYKSYARVVAHLYPQAMRPQSAFGAVGIAPGSFVHPEARLENGVIVDPGAVIGPRAEIGSGTLVGAHAVIGPDVRIGRDCCIGPHASLGHCLIGNRVIIHAGARIGQDGFGFAMGPGGHLKVPQVGRVVVQDDVDIGANTTIDRGANRDTLIGEGSKIDNQVMIGHNVTIGRHCVIVSQVGISGSTEVGDFVAMGGQAGLAGHLRIGAGAQVAAKAGVMTDIPAGGRWGGSPARPMREFFRSVALIEKMLKASGHKATREDEG